ncbi:YqkE family protein [Litchfieldia alkalitelluris]|uniref:YqkE family protein n=1 Tax=Litchfieldia alkalitelluris TaxID=304268 RepID=UPI000996711D|nr:YqkE family protein [Litchfieldia alkalitelluris]
MAKKKHKEKPKKKQDDKLSLGDLLNEDIVSKLKNTQKELKEKEQRELELEEERKRKERKEREKNKSFEELFNESSLKWSDFKDK